MTEWFEVLVLVRFEVAVLEVSHCGLEIWYADSHDACAYARHPFWIGSRLWMSSICNSCWHVGMVTWDVAAWYHISESSIHNHAISSSELMTHLCDLLKSHTWCQASLYRQRAWCQDWQAKSHTRQARSVFRLSVMVIIHCSTQNLEQSNMYVSCRTNEPLQS